LLREFRNLEEVVLVLLTVKDETIGVDKDVKFVEPKGELEVLLRMWIDFGQSVVVEEKLLESVCREMGKEYEPWSLPSVRIRSKMLKV